jgi:hypothetical protein
MEKDYLVLKRASATTTCWLAAMLWVASSGKRLARGNVVDVDASLWARGMSQVRAPRPAQLQTDDGRGLPQRTLVGGRRDQLTTQRVIAGSFRLIETAPNEKPTLRSCGVI